MKLAKPTFVYILELVGSAAEAVVSVVSLASIQVLVLEVAVEVQKPDTLFGGTPF